MNDDCGKCPMCGEDLMFSKNKKLLYECSNAKCNYVEFQYQNMDKGKKKPGGLKMDGEELLSLIIYTEWLKKQNISDDSIKTYISGAKKYIQFLNSQDQSQHPFMSKGRKDYTKYIFNKQIAGKSPMFYIVIKDYVKNNPEKTLSDLNKDFPKWINQTSLFKEWTEVTTKEWEQNRFRKDSIVLGNGTKIALTTQWTKSSFENFRRMAKKYGLNIEIYHM